jgi:uncharacterized protein (DUF697 family)
MKVPINPLSLRTTMKRHDAEALETRTLAVGGARELAAVLRRELARGARPGAVRDGDAPEGAAVLVYVIGREPTEEDEKALKRARKARVPIVVVAAGPVSDDLSLPFVPATDIVRVGAGAGFPIDEIAHTIAVRLREEAALLAAGVPALRGAVSAHIVRSFSRKNAVVSALIFVPGADLPVLTLNQIRMILKLGHVHGRKTSRDLIPEMAVTFGAGLGLRTVARTLLDFVPVAGWAVKSAVAYTGTRALGEAAVLRLSEKVDVDAAPGGDATRPPAGASPGAP